MHFTIVLEGHNRKVDAPVCERRVSSAVIACATCVVAAAALDCGGASSRHLQPVVCRDTPTWQKDQPGDCTYPGTWLNLLESLTVMEELGKVERLAP